ncbi:hypothetical protein B484DRAFT_188163 [Ochromonadaceae sp. CCMP2298]|nr:hypothetical protein B484DRAFT_188163 [Ochromonadaceae sp. CCMP2298]
MGCVMSESAQPLRSPGSVKTPKSKRHVSTSSGVQDEARSYRSKQGAIKMLIKNTKSRQAFLEFLQTENKEEIMTCYQDLVEIRLLTDDQAFTRTSALVWRYKAQSEAARRKGADAQKGARRDNSLEVQITVWDCLGQLRHIDKELPEREGLIRLLALSQNDLLAKLIVPFEGFLESRFYKHWQNQQVEEERQLSREKKKAGPPSIAASIRSTRTETFSTYYPDVLIVDDSLVTLKITGLTLEKDGHTVERAKNGLAALDMLKQRMYDVVLIDLNMPVMDGFETIRLFREYEKAHVQRLKKEHMPEEEEEGVDDMSDISEEETPEVLEDIKTMMGGAGTASKKRPDTATSRKQKYRYLDECGKEVIFQPQLIIGMSTNVDEVTRRRALDAGMDFFLPKPFTLQKFTEIVKIIPAPSPVRYYLESDL